MKQILVFLLFVSVSGSGVLAQKAEQKAIKATFEKYKAAILSDKGEEATRCVDSRTIAYYDTLAEKIRHADSASLQSLSFLDRFSVLVIKHRAPAEFLKECTGRQLFIYAIEHGMVGKETVMGNAVGAVVVEGDFAKGQMIIKGKKQPFYFHFYKEDRLWRFDLTSVFPLVRDTFEQLATINGMSANEYAFMLLELVSGTKPTSELWKPLIP